MTFAVVFPGQGSQFDGHGGPVDHPPGRPGGAGRGLRGDGARPSSPAATTQIASGYHRVRAAGPAGVRRGGVPGAGGRGPASERLAGAAGHSLGEFAALVAAGTMLLPEALDLVVVRGEAMQRAGEERPGTMSALIGVGTETAAGALRRGARGRRAGGRQPELPRAGRDQRAASTRSNGPRRSRRNGRSGRSGSTWPARSTRALMEPAVAPILRDARRHRAPHARLPDRRERDRHAGGRPGRAPELVGATRRLAGAVGTRRAGARRRRRHHLPRGGPGRRAHEAGETDGPGGGDGVSGRGRALPRPAAAVRYPRRRDPLRHHRRRGLRRSRPASCPIRGSRRSSRPTTSGSAIAPGIEARHFADDGIVTLRPRGGGRRVAPWSPPASRPSSST